MAKKKYIGNLYLYAVGKNLNMIYTTFAVITACAIALNSIKSGNDIPMSLTIGVMAGFVWPLLVIISLGYAIVINTSVKGYNGPKG